jgi:hypothetical protein
MQIPPPASEQTSTQLPVAPRRPVRTAASGPCRCSRRTCWHARDCRSGGVVRILRASPTTEKTNCSVVLCRECAAPTQRMRMA